MARDPFEVIFNGINRCRFLIVIFWLGMIGVGIWRAPKLFNNLQVRAETYADQ